MVGGGVTEMSRAGQRGGGVSVHTPLWVWGQGPLRSAEYGKLSPEPSACYEKQGKSLSAHL